MRRMPLAVLLALFCVSSAAQADVLPPDKKQIEYTFVVTGFASSADQVLFAYPCSDSIIPNVDAYRKLEDGRAEHASARSGACAFYTASKSSHDAFAAGYKPTETDKNPALDAFVASATKCTGGTPTPTSYIDQSDPRTAINESFVVRTLTATECALDSTSPPPTPAPNPTSDTSPPKSSSKGCSVGPSGRTASTFALAVAFVAFAAFALRRDKRE